MKKFTAGVVTVEIEGPYPCRFTISHPEAISLLHNDLKDLEHCLSRARTWMRDMLGELYAHELD